MSINLMKYVNKKIKLSNTHENYTFGHLFSLHVLTGEGGTFAPEHKVSLTILISFWYMCKHLGFWRRITPKNRVGISESQNFDRIVYEKFF